MKKRKEYLGRGISAFVSPSHGFGTDAMLLAYFSAPRSRDVCCDLGTGCGIIPLLWCREPFPAKITAVEIQKEACDLARQSIALAGLEDRLQLVQGDLRRLQGVLPAAGYSLVTMNPPYKPLATGIESRSEAEKIARHEVMCTLRDAAEAAARLLRFGGRFVMCHRPERVFDVLTAYRAAGMEPKRLRFVSDRAELPPFLFLIEGKKGAKPGLHVLPQLIIKERDGKITPEMWQVYGEFAMGYEK